MLYKNAKQRMQTPVIAAQTDGTIYLNGKHLNAVEIEALYQFLKEHFNNKYIIC